jgi:AraC-like DNA-binding protein
MSKKRQTTLLAAKAPSEGVLVRSYAIRHTHPHVIAYHHHSWHQLIYATEGVLTVRTFVGDWVIPPNRAVWVPAEVEHSIEWGESVFLQTLYFHPGLKQALPTRCQAVNVSPLLRELIGHIVRKGPLDQVIAENDRLIAFLLDQINLLETIPMQLPLPQDLRAKMASQWVMAHPDDSTTVNQLAKQSNASARTLERLFLEETGLTLGRWRQQARLFHALKLLAKGDPANKVAAKTGYASPSAFIHAFRKFFGTTPGNYFQ